MSYVGDACLRWHGEQLRCLSGDPVDGIGSPFPPVVVVYVLSNPFPGDCERVL